MLCVIAAFYHRHPLLSGPRLLLYQYWYVAKLSRERITFSRRDTESIPRRRSNRKHQTKRR